MANTKKTITVAIAGLGAAGMPVAEWLDRGVPGLELTAVSAGNKERATERVSSFHRPPPVVSIQELPDYADVIVEGLPPALFFDLAVPVVEQGKTLVCLTATRLLERPQLVDQAEETGAKIIVPTGALAAFDAVRAAQKGVIHSLTMVTRKPPRGLVNAPFVKEQGLDLTRLNGPTCLYKGSVRDAAAKFPANVNVAVALSLAGPGPDETSYEIWADPAVERNTHTIIMDSDSTHLEFTIAGIPIEENPATGKLTPLSVIATLEAMVSPLRIGS